MEQLVRREVAGRVAVAVVTERADGDIRPDVIDGEQLLRRQQSLTGARWMMADEVHGTDLIDVDEADPPAWPIAGTADVLMASISAEPLAVWVADCAPIALFGANGSTRVVIHAGWRGIADGVIDVGVDALEAAGTTVAFAVLGPCIHRCCYEFGARDLERVAAGAGVVASEVAGTTSWGTDGLDVPAAVEAALARRGVAVDVAGRCTGCDSRFYSHRRRAEPERHALVAWFEAVA